MIPCDAIMNFLIEKIGDIDLQIVELALKNKVKDEMAINKKKN